MIYPHCKHCAWSSPFHPTGPHETPCGSPGCAGNALEDPTLDGAA